MDKIVFNGNINMLRYYIFGLDVLMFKVLLIDGFNHDFSIFESFDVKNGFNGVHLYPGKISGFNIKGANFSHIDIYEDGKLASSSFVGGTLSAEMRRAGYSDVFVKNSTVLHGIEINDNLVKFVDGNLLKGVSIDVQMDVLMGKGSIVTTGPAADVQNSLATINVDGNDYQLRNGAGACFLASGVKYITVKGTRFYDEITSITEHISNNIDLTDNVILHQYHIERYGLLMISKFIHDRKILNFKLPEIKEDFKRTGCTCSGEMYRFFNDSKQELPCYDSYIKLSKLEISFKEITEILDFFKKNGIDLYLASSLYSAEKMSLDEIIGQNVNFYFEQLIEGLDDERYYLNDNSNGHKMYSRFFESSLEMGIDPYFVSACSLSTYENLCGLISDVIKKI